MITKIYLQVQYTSTCASIVVRRTFKKVKKVQSRDIRGAVMRHLVHAWHHIQIDNAVDPPREI